MMFSIEQCRSVVVEKGREKALLCCKRIFVSCTIRLICFFLILPSVVSRVQVSSDSMSPTVRTGDYLVVETVCMRARKALSYLCEIKRGDVVVFENPTDRYDVSGKNDLMVKRVAGLAGDRLRIERGKLVINGNVVPETYKPWADMPGQTP